MYDGRRRRVAQRGVRAVSRRFRLPSAAGLLEAGAGLLGILLIHTVWELFDASPASWDGAYHQLLGWHLLEAAREGRLWGNLARLSPEYPPLYYLQEAWILGWLGNTQFLALLANLPGLAMLVWATYLLLRNLVQPPWLAGACACLPLLLPFTAWVSRQTLLDIGLAGFASMAGFLVLASRGFTRLSPTLFFGLICLGGILTKWTLPLYLLGPLVFGLLFLSRNRVLSLRNLFLAGLLVVPVSLFYYAPLLSELAGSYPITEQSGVIPWKPYPPHGEPGLDNIWGWIYYPRVIAGYFLQLPLMLLLLLSFTRVTWASREPEPSPLTRSPGGKTAAVEVLPTEPRQVLGLCLWWLLAGLFLLIFLTPKDPRFFLPLICPLSVLLVWPWRKRPRWLTALLAVAALQFLLVSFETPLGPLRLASWVWDDEDDYQSLQHEWVWFQTYYFDAAGPPDPRPWHHSEILARIEAGSRLGFLPELARFNPHAFLLESVRQKIPLEVVRLGNDPDWESTLSGLDYLIGKTGNQGISFVTEFNEPIMEEFQQWQLVQEWPLPDGSQAQLRQRP